MTSDQLTLTDELAALRIVVLLLIPAPHAIDFRRVMSRWRVDIRIASSTGKVEVLSEIPRVTFAPGDPASRQVLSARAAVSAGADLSWEFGDGSGLSVGSSQRHGDARARGHSLTLRAVCNSRLSELKAHRAASRSRRLIPPLTVFPALARDTTATEVSPGHTRIVAVVNAAEDDAMTAI